MLSHSASPHPTAYVSAHTPCHQNRKDPKQCTLRIWGYLFSKILAFLLSNCSVSCYIRLRYRVIMATLSSLVASQIVMASCAANSDDKVAIMATLGFQFIRSWKINSSYIVFPNLTVKRRVICEYLFEIAIIWTDNVRIQCDENTNGERLRLWNNIPTPWVSIYIYMYMFKDLSTIVPYIVLSEERRGNEVM